MEIQIKIHSEIVNFFDNEPQTINEANILNSKIEMVGGEVWGPKCEFLISMIELDLRN